MVAQQTTDLGRDDTSKQPNAQPNEGRATKPAQGTRPVAPARVLEQSTKQTTTQPILSPRSSKVAKTFALRAFQSVDFIVLVATSVFAFGLASPLSLGMAPFAISAPFVLVPLLLAIGLNIAGAYNFAHAETLLSHWGKTFSGLSLGAVLSVMIAVISGLPALEMGVLLGMLALTMVAILCLHANYMALITSWTRSGALATNVLMIGATANARDLIEKNAAIGELNVVGIFEERAARAPSQIADVPVLGSIDDLLGWEHLPHIDRIIITVTSTATTRVRTLIDRLRGLPQDLVLFLDMDNFNPEKTSLAQIAQAPMAYISGAPRDEMRAISKRVQDIVFASLMLVAFAPVMAVVAVAIKLDSKGPALFRQKRHGFNNQVIEVLKFRSMKTSKADGPMQQVTHDDDRITRIGRFIRRTSLDELPQLFNVLLGNMSLVGPRPHAIDMHTGDVQSRLLVAEYAHRHRVKPGLTGWAQINGSRGPLHTADDVRERVRLDVEYIDRANFWFDFVIMLKTAPCLLGDKTNTR